MRAPIRICLSILLIVAVCSSCRADDHPNEALAHAIKLSSLTGSHAQPFHIKLSVSEPDNPSSPYRATIEEFWLSKTLWQRTIDSPTFQQHLVVKDGIRNEQDNGDYYPLWLRNFVTASIDPLEDVAFWNQVSARMVLTTGSSSGLHTSCARAQFKMGTPAVNNDAFAVICFNSDGTLSNVVRPGYGMEFHDAQEFGKKRIARRYVDDPEPGTTLVGIVDVLEQIEKGAALPQLADLANPTTGPINRTKINQDTFNQLSSGQPGLVWPPVHSGNTSGKLSMYVSADRGGHIREAYPLNSDNAGLQDAARDQLLKWQLKPAVVNGVRTQIEAALTFEFSTKLGDAPKPSVAASSLPLAAATPIMGPIKISPAIANSLRIRSYAPVYPQDLRFHRIGGKVELNAVIGRNGQIVSLTPISSTNDEFTSSAIAAVKHWSYKPYLLNGSPVEIETVITIHFNAP